MKLKGLLVVAAVGFPLHEAGAQFVTYTDRAAFQAAAGALQTENFNSTSPQILASPATGTFTLPYSNITLSGNSNGDYFAIADGTNPGNIDGSNFFYFSERNPTTTSYDGNGNQGPTFTFNFTVPSLAFGFDWVDTDPTDSYDFTVNGTTFTTPPFSLNGTGSGFFGIIAASAANTFTQATFSQNAAGGVVDPFGIDNVSFTTQPPVSAVPEPSTYVLMGTGLAALGAIGRRRRTPGV